MNAFINQLNDMFGEEIPYLPHNVKNTIINYGVPPVKIQGFDYFFAVHLNPQSSLRMSLTGKGVFVNNTNTSGIIEFAVMSSTVSAAMTQVLNATGVAWPIFTTDTSTKGTGSVAGSACRLIQTPEWRRELFPSMSIFTFHTPRLLINHGVRFPA